jgi:pimeloyl-[acyl-carrier protein] methyl ester esterase
MKVMTLSGWGQQAEALKDILPPKAKADFCRYSHYQGPDKLFTALRRKKPQADVLIGWSLGGQLAARLVEEGIVRPKLLVLLAAPYQYVADTNHPYGVNQLMFWTFCQSFRSFPAKTMQHFILLVAQGDDHMREMARQINIDSENLEEWADWLDVLGEYSSDRLSCKNFPRTLIVHGLADQVVPVAQASAWHEKIKNSRLELLEFCGHAPHLHAPEKIKVWIKEELIKKKS